MKDYSKGSRLKCIHNPEIHEDGTLTGEEIDVDLAIEKQVAITPVFRKFTYESGYFCGACDHLISRDFQYCPTCGQKIKWEGNEVVDL